MQTISMSADKEIAIGLQNAPQMAQQHGGLHPDTKYQALVDNVGNKLVNSSIAGADMGGLVGGIGQQKLLTNGRDDELESDELGVLFMIKAGYNPQEMIGVMKILKEAAGPNRVPEFQSTHPDPGDRNTKRIHLIKGF